MVFKGDLDVVLVGVEGCVSEWFRVEVEAGWVCWCGNKPGKFRVRVWGGWGDGDLSGGLSSGVWYGGEIVRARPEGVW